MMATKEPRAYEIGRAFYDREEVACQRRTEGGGFRAC
jgi:hypothetical protein